jgi:hypothetical protein
MSCIGFFSWLYLRNALATSRMQTMVRANTACFPT